MFLCHLPEREVEPVLERIAVDKIKSTSFHMKVNIVSLKVWTHF